MSFRPFRSSIRRLARFATSLVASFAVPGSARRRRAVSREAPPAAPLPERVPAGPAGFLLHPPAAPLAAAGGAVALATAGGVAADSAAQRLRRLMELRRMAGSSGVDRSRAMQEAGRWGHPAVLPLLRRGLRDADPAVMAAAARAMERFRGKPVRRLAAQAAPLPRRVARTR